MRLFHTVVREIPENLKPIMMMNILAAVSAIAFVALVSTAAQSASTDGVSARLMLMFIITVIIIQITHNYTLVKASQDAEQLIHKLRIRLFDLVRRTDLVTIEKIGHANLQGVLTQDTQVLAQILPLLVIGLQQAIMLVFLAGYLAWLSPIACVLAFGLAGMAVAVRFARVKALRSLMQSAAVAEGRIFNGLTELLNGFKEVRMSGPRAEGLTKSLAADSQEARKNNVLLKSQWGRNYAVIEVMLYSLAGLIVFVVPLFAPDFYKVVLPVTITVLFISGPVSTVSFVTPMVTQAELALENIEIMEERLIAVAEDSAPETNDKLKTASKSIALSDAMHSYRDAKGEPLFTVGPINAKFKAGQITFITGGNGSGKSTLLRLLTGLIPLDSGHLLANTEPLTTGQMQDYRDRISAVFADFHLSRRIYCINDRDPDKIETLLKRFDISDKVTVENDTFSTIDLSTGQRKRLAFMVAELEDKPVIVLDEWAADQDPHFRCIFYEKLLPELKTRGKIIICVTHDDRWFHMADRMYHMDEGKIIEVSNKRG
jgi:cyclic peptide transporter